MSDASPRALVVFESMFGNTDAVAHAIGRGLDLSGWQVDLAEVSTAPRGEEVQHDLSSPVHPLMPSR